MDKIFSVHETNYNSTAEVAVQVPGVMTLMGAFSDFCKGYCITGGSTRSLRLAISKRNDNIVKLFDATRCDRKHFIIQNTLKYKKEDRWANYIKGVFYELGLEGYKFTDGLNITIKGGLLYCEDLTISSSLTIAILLALNSLYDLKIERQELCRIAYQSISRFCKLNCRYRDLVTLLFCEENKVLFFDLQSTSFEKIDYPFIKGNNGVYGLILDPLVPHQYLRQEIEEKRELAHQCLEKLEVAIPCKIRDFSIMELRSRVVDSLTEHERRTCEYVITETHSAARGHDALVKGDHLNFAKHLRDIYIGMRDVFEITCLEVDWLIKRAHRTEGVYGASLISNGFTGSIFLVLDEKGEANLQEHLVEYKKIFDYDPTIRPYIPSGCAKELEAL